MAARLDPPPETRPRRLAPVAQPRVWGRERLGAWGLGLETAQPSAIGEIHHGDDAGLPLLVKTLFTSAMLSVQVHPDDAAARIRGLPHGKDEAWVILAAEPGARIGLGMRTACDAATLRAAAGNATILDLLAWHSCAAGDVFFVPAGTIHAIGPGVTLFEVQQNCDVTFRLYDHGRGRALHLEDGVAVAELGAWSPRPRTGQVLVEGPHFVLERVCAGAGIVAAPPGRPVWLAVIGGGGRLGRSKVAPGEVWLVEAAAVAVLAGSVEMLLAYPGGVAANVWRED